MKTILPTTLALAFATGILSAANPDVEPPSPYFEIHGEHRTDVFPLKETHVEVGISGTIAQVTLIQTYTNDGENPIDATYIFPASTDAAVNGMTMTIGERVLTAKVETKEQARKTFEKAKSENKSASLLSQQRPNVFQMEVARIMPGDEVKLTLRYSQLLVPVSGVYEFLIPTAVGPRYTKGGKAEDFSKNPFLKKGEKTVGTFSVNLALGTPLPLQSLACSTHDVSIDFHSKDRATLKLSATTPDRDFIVRYRLAQDEIASGLLLHEGEGENFFVLQVEPPENVSEQNIPGRDYIFLVDVSGSMGGFPINLAKKLFRDLISDLRTTDTFNVVLFAGSSEVLSPNPLAATERNTEKAISFLSHRSGGGGTELMAGMKKALALPTDKDTSRSLVLITDGFITAESDVFELIRNGANDTNIFPLGVGSSVNRHLIDGLAHVAGNDSFVVTHSGETKEAVKRFRAAVTSPVLTGITVTGDGFETSELLPRKLPDLFANRPLSLIGKWTGKPEGMVTLSGITGEGKTYEKIFTVADAAKDMDNPSLPTLWARETVRSLADYAKLTGNPKIIEEVTNVGLKYELLTPFTSFVAVDAIPRKPENAPVPIKQALPLPSGVGNEAVGGSVPEPDTFIMIALALIATSLLRIR